MNNLEHNLACDSIDADIVNAGPLHVGAIDVDFVYPTYLIAAPPIVLLHSMISCWHRDVVRVSVCPSVCNAVYCALGVGVES